MDNLIYVLFISIFIPIGLLTLLVDKKSRLPLIFMILGIFISVLSSEINGLIMNTFKLNLYYMTINITPITEEVLKALPILFYAIFITDKKETLFTSAMAMGIGFAVIENMYYLIGNVGFNILDAIIRAFGSGLMHGMCTLLVGAGIAFVKKKRKLFMVGTFSLLITAIMYHSIYNMLIQSQISIVGALFPIITYIPFLVWRLVKTYKKNKVLEVKE